MLPGILFRCTRQMHYIHVQSDPATIAAHMVDSVLTIPINVPSGYGHRHTRVTVVDFVGECDGSRVNASIQMRTDIKPLNSEGAYTVLAATSTNLVAATESDGFDVATETLNDVVYSTWYSGKLQGGATFEFSGLLRQLPVQFYNGRLLTVDDFTILNPTTALFTRGVAFVGFTLAIETF